MSDSVDHELHATIMASALSSTLEPDEGIIVHYQGKGYFVFLSHDPGANTYDVVVNADDAFLKVPNFERVNMNEDLPNLWEDDDEEITLQ